MDDDSMPFHLRPVTAAEIARDASALGVRSGDVVMVHTRMSAIGWVVGGADAVVLGLLEALGTDGSLMVLAGGHDDTYYDMGEWPERWRHAYLEGMPAFDPEVSEVSPEYGRLPERIRTWPGALRSAHPESAVAAIGARAAWLVDPHPGDDGFGPGTPYARLVEAGGKVLMLGAPLDTITMLHHAESIADGRGKRFVTYRSPVKVGDAVEWREFHDIDSSDRGAFPYEDILPEGLDAFDAIATDALAAGIGVRGTIGDATSHLFDAPALVRFAVDWIEERFPAGDAGP
jgi:aminoglycoside 3-N-acetyltransferase